MGGDKALNQDQQRAVTHFQGPCMVYAGPGSGKTTVITQRIAHLIRERGVKPNQILVITFTKAAAEEMQERFQRLAEAMDLAGKGVQFGTFHSVFFRILRTYEGYQLSDTLSEGEKYNIIKGLAQKLEINYGDDEELIRDAILDIGLYYSHYLTKGQFRPQSLSQEDFQRLLKSYENYKENYRKIDFDDMLIKCYELLQRQPQVLERLRRQFQYILIDEFQDINEIQFHMVKLLSYPLNNLFVVGDDDQSIYSFRGGRPDFILDFKKHYPQGAEITIAVNYRSQEKIIQAANRLIKHNQKRIPKEITPFHGPGPEIIYVEPKDRVDENLQVCALIMEALKEGVPLGEIAVIYRTNLMVSGLVNDLLESHIPFYCKDQIFNLFEHWTSQDILAYLSCANQILDSKALRRIINKPTRYIPKKALEEAAGYHKDLISGLKYQGNLMSYQMKFLETLELDLKNIRNLSTHEAIQYIRKEVNYDRYIESYCVEKGISSNGLFEILDELEEAALKTPSQLDFLVQVRDFKLRLQHSEIKSKGKDKVNLLTMHGAKGLEFQRVIIIGAVEGVVPHHKVLEDPQGIEEERRLFYVAVTRAKERLMIFSPRLRFDKPTEISRFVQEMQGEAIHPGGLTLGKTIVHRVFGKGIIESITAGIMKVRFEQGNQVKQLDVEHCLKHRILREESNQGA